MVLGNRMKRLSRPGAVAAGRIWRAVAVVALLPALGAAQEGAAARCPAGSPPVGDLGITSFSCHCSLEVEDDGSTHDWVFNTELEILSVASAGPAAGVLQKGDVVVAIDGDLITTPARGDRWGDVEPGDEVRLRIRRNGALLDVSIRAGRQCPDASPEASPADTSTTSTLPPRFLPRGWVGMSLVCDCSFDAGREIPLWTFLTPPSVAGIVPSGPAAHAGIREGDVLLEINGVPLDTREGGRVFSRLAPGDQVRLLLQRGAKRMTVQLRPGTPPGG